MDQTNNKSAERADMVVLLDEDNVEHRFIIVEVVEIEGAKYAILEAIDKPEDPAYILRFEKDEDGQDVLVTIEDDQEWQLVISSIEDDLN